MKNTISVTASKSAQIEEEQLQTLGIGRSSLSSCMGSASQSVKLGTSFIEPHWSITD